jgi:hypothetical protein
MSGGIAPSFLTSAADGGEWSASRLCRFTPGEKVPVFQWIGRWAGLRFGLHAVENREILPCRESNPYLPTRSPSLYRLLYPDSSELLRASQINTNETNMNYLVCTVLTHKETTRACSSQVKGETTFYWVIYANVIFKMPEEWRDCNFLSGGGGLAERNTLIS